MFDNYCAIGLDMFYNEYVLNIFSDASMRSKGQKAMDGCYGTVAVVKDQIIDQDMRVLSDTTVNACEIRGIRMAISMANKYKYKFRYINIFSDSIISLLGLRDYIYNWTYDSYTQLFYGSSNKPIINQSVFIECMLMLEELRKTNIVNLFHQKGHVKTNSIEDLKRATKTFATSNNINAKIDYNIIRYISCYNEVIDKDTRSYLNRTNIHQLVFKDPIEFNLGKGKLINREEINHVRNVAKEKERNSKKSCFKPVKKYGDKGGSQCT